MQVNNISGVSFQAHINKNLSDKLFVSANRLGEESCSAYFNKVKKVESWGESTSAITDIKPNGEPCPLSLINAYLAPFKRVELPQKGNLLDTFMALKEKDILKAESSLQI